MKKLLMAVSVAGLVVSSGAGFASDKTVAAAWSGVSDSIARAVRTPSAQSIVTSVSQSTSILVRALTGRDAPWSAAADDSGKTSVGACPYCPEPPCM